MPSPSMSAELSRLGVDKAGVDGARNSIREFVIRRGGETKPPANFVRPSWPNDYIEHLQMQLATWLNRPPWHHQLVESCVRDYKLSIAVIERIMAQQLRNQLALRASPANRNMSLCSPTTLPSITVATRPQYPQRSESVSPPHPAEPQSSDRGNKSGDVHSVEFANSSAESERGFQHLRPDTGKEPVKLGKRSAAASSSGAVPTFEHDALRVAPFCAAPRSLEKAAVASIAHKRRRIDDNRPIRWMTFEYTHGSQATRLPQYQSEGAEVSAWDPAPSTAALATPTLDETETSESRAGALRTLPVSQTVGEHGISNIIDLTSDIEDGATELQTEPDRSPSTPVAPESDISLFNHVFRIPDYRLRLLVRSLAVVIEEQSDSVNKLKDVITMIKTSHIPGLYIREEMLSVREEQIKLLSEHFVNKFEASAAVD